jgi:hypothetical protein
MMLVIARSGNDAAIHVALGARGQMDCHARTRTRNGASDIQKFARLSKADWPPRAFPHPQKIKTGDARRATRLEPISR